MMKIRALALVLTLAPALAFAGAVDEFKVRRTEPFEFARMPTVTRDGDRVTIRFKAKAFCDATVAVEHADGKIVRHLASGVLGGKAPRPFQKNALEQTLVWDGKDEQGRYVDDLDRVVVRVSLGLRARFERQFLWSPHRRIAVQGGTDHDHAATPSFCAQPEGVYLFDGRMFDHLRLFDHEGRYVRTVYPFPGDKLDEVKGVPRREFPQSGKTLPVRGGTYETTFLNSGTNWTGGHGRGELFGLAATGLAVRKGRIALVCKRLNRLATDGSTGGLALEGPSTSIGGRRPRSAAFSPDGRTLYVTGFSKATGGPNWHLHWAHGVAKLDFAAGKKMETFTGSLTGGHKTGGSKPGQFKTPCSLDCGPKGRVYVADHFNDRVQVFDPSGRHLKSIPVKRPAEVCVDQRTGEIYVFTWYLDDWAFRRTGPPVPKLTHFGPFENPEVKGAYPIPIYQDGHHRNVMRMGRYGGDAVQGRQFRAMVDSWAPGGPTVWMIRWIYGKHGSAADGCPLVLRIDSKKRKLVTVRNFARTAKQHLPRLEWPGHGRMRLMARPTTGEVYAMGNHRRPLIVIDPDTGKIRAVRLPFSPDEMTFDINGHAYLRTHRNVVRYDLTNGRWREVPFDYGEQRGKVGLWNGNKAGKIIAALPIDTPNIHHQGGIWVSPRGHVAVAFILGAIKTSGFDRHKNEQRKQALQGWKRWKPTIFPGRGGHTIVRVWDKHGRVVYGDAVRGVGYIDGIFMDRNDNLYVTSAAKRAGYFDKLTGTLAKFKPEGKILTPSSTIPLGRLRPDRPHDTTGGAIGKAWWQAAEWFYGGIGFTGKDASASHACNCPNYRPAHDYFARTFVPETQHYTVGVLDKAGNLVLRMGRYGNVDDGVPLVKGEKVEGWDPTPLGGDEIGLFFPVYLGTHTDRRLYINDPGNARILSVRLDYHTSRTVPLKAATDGATARR
ncbi:MAG: hypothetical protein R6V58_11205 [Planctomycetota bacterium]